MAPKKPKNYPVLPRLKGPKKPFKRSALLINLPEYFNEHVFYDKLYVPFNTYTPVAKNLTTPINFGNYVKSGTSNPGWRAIIAAGGDASSNYSRKRIKVLKYTSYTIRSWDSTWVSSGSGVLARVPLVYEPTYTQLEDVALGRLKNRLRDKVGNAQLGPPLAESREIGRLVRQINGLGMSTFRALLAAKATKGASLAKQFSDAWLGFGFGVNPLLQDIKSAADAILHYVTRDDRRVVVSASASRRYISGYKEDKNSSQDISVHTTAGWHSTGYHWQGVRYTAGVDVIVRAGSNYSMADHLGLKVEQLPSILWELTPYSWAVDYFTTVGSYLDDVFYTLPATVKYLVKGYKYESNTMSTLLPINIPGSKSVVKSTGTKIRYTYFARQKLAPTLPTRSLRVKSIDEIASHGLTKILNLATVLISRNGPKV